MYQIIRFVRQSLDFLLWFFFYKVKSFLWMSFRLISVLAAFRYRTTCSKVFFLFSLFIRKHINIMKGHFFKKTNLHYINDISFTFENKRFLWTLVVYFQCYCYLKISSCCERTFFLIMVCNTFKFINIMDLKSSCLK